MKDKKFCKKSRAKSGKTTKAGFESVSLGSGNVVEMKSSWNFHFKAGFSKLVIPAMLSGALLFSLP